LADNNDEGWIPPKRDLILEVALLVVLPVTNIVQAALAGRTFSEILLTTLGTIVLLLALIYVYEALMRPLRRRLTSDEDLITMIDGWLRELGFGRVDHRWPGMSHALRVVDDSSNITRVFFVGKSERLKQVKIFSGRQPGSEQADVFARMNLRERADMLFEMHIELSKLGVWYQVYDEVPEVHVFFYLFTDQGLTRRQFLDAFFLVTRADHLVVMIARKHMAEKLKIDEPVFNQQPDPPADNAGIGG